MSKGPTIKDNDALVTKVVAAIEGIWEEGCPVASDASTTAPVAIRRWSNSQRRGVPQDDRPARIRDLAKGLMTRFESHPDSNILRDYHCVAERVAQVIEPPAD